MFRSTTSKRNETDTLLGLNLRILGNLPFDYVGILEIYGQHTLRRIHRRKSPSHCLQFNRAQDCVSRLTFLLFWTTSDLQYRPLEPGLEPFLTNGLQARIMWHSTIGMKERVESLIQRKVLHQMRRR
jgi:hypothetical protein